MPDSRAIPAETLNRQPVDDRRSTLGQQSHLDQQSTPNRQSTLDQRSPSEVPDTNRPPSMALLLFSAYRSMESRIFGALSRAGFGDVTPAQGRLFRGVRPGGSRMTELAEAARVTKQTAGFLVEQLERSGYVTRVPDPADARARLVKIAPKGAAAISIGAAIVAEAEAEWAASIGPERMAGLRDTLQMLWDRPA